MHLSHYNCLVTLGKATQSQGTTQETEYVANTDIKCTFLLDYIIRITEGIKA